MLSLQSTARPTIYARWGKEEEAHLRTLMSAEPKNTLEFVHLRYDIWSLIYYLTDHRLGFHESVDPQETITMLVHRAKSVKNPELDPDGVPLPLDAATSAEFDRLVATVPRDTDGHMNLALSRRMREMSNILLFHLADGDPRFAQLEALRKKYDERAAYLFDTWAGWITRTKG